MSLIFHSISAAATRIPAGAGVVGKMRKSVKKAKR
jgi:hypothetical protein